MWRLVQKAYARYVSDEAAKRGGKVARKEAEGSKHSITGLRGSWSRKECHQTSFRVQAVRIRQTVRKRAKEMKAPEDDV